MANPQWSKLLKSEMHNLSDSVVVVSSTFDRFERSLNVVERTSSAFTGILSSMTKNFSGLGVVSSELFRNYEKYISTFDKLNRQTLSYGQSNTILEKRLDSLTKTTNLSKKELLDLTSALDSKLLGTRNYTAIDGVISRVNQLGKTAEETRRMLDSLAQTQSKFGTGLGSFRGITGMALSQMDRQSFNDLLQTNFMRPENLRTRGRQQLGGFQGVRTRQEELELGIQRGITPIALNAAGGINNFFQNTLGIDSAGAISAGGLFAGIAGGGLLYNAMGNFRGLSNRIGSGKTISTTGAGGIFGPGAAGGMGMGSFPVTVQNWPVSLSAGGGGPYGPRSSYYGPASAAPTGAGMGGNAANRLGKFAGRGLIGAGLGMAAYYGGSMLAEAVPDLLERFGVFKNANPTTKQVLTGGLQGAAQYGSIGLGMGAMVGGLPGMLIGGTLGVLGGSAIGASSAHKKAVDDQKKVENTAKLVDIQKEIDRELMKEQINEGKINDLVKQHNDLVGDQGQHLNANVTIIQGMFDKMQGFVKLNETMMGMLEDQVKSLQSMSNFYGTISMEGEKSEQTAIRAAEKQIDIINRQEAAWNKIKDLRDTIRAKGEQNAVAELKKADELTKAYEDQFHTKFDDVETEQKILEFSSKRLEANSKLVDAQLQQEQVASKTQEIYTQQAEAYERISKTAKVGIGAEVGAILNTAQQYTKELNIQQQQIQQMQKMLNDTNAQYQKIQQDQSLTSEQKREKLEQNRTQESKIRFEMEKKQVDVLNSQSKILEKLLTLREKYVSALPEIGFSGFDFEASFDVTRQNGLALFGAQNQFVGGRSGGGLRYTSGGVSPLGGVAGFSGPTNAYGMFGTNNMGMQLAPAMAGGDTATRAALQRYNSGGMVKRGQLQGPTGGWLAELHDSDAAVLTQQQLTSLGLTPSDLMAAGVPAFKGLNKSGTSLPRFAGGGLWGGFGYNNPLFDIASIPFRAAGSLVSGLGGMGLYVADTVRTFAANRLIGPKKRIADTSFLYPWQRKAMESNAFSEEKLQQAIERNKRAQNAQWWQTKTDAEFAYEYKNPEKHLNIVDDGIDRNINRTDLFGNISSINRTLDWIGKRKAAGLSANPYWRDPFQNAAVSNQGTGLPGSGYGGILSGNAAKEAAARQMQMSMSTQGSLNPTSDISGNVNVQIGFDQSGNLIVKNMHKQFTQAFKGATNGGNPQPSSGNTPSGTL